jgi:hypothetical protein
MIKRQFPKTYEYVYNLVTKGMHDDSYLKDEHIFMLTTYLLQDAADDHLENYQIADLFDLDREMARKLFNFMLSLQSPSFVTNFKLDFAKSFVKKNQFRIEDLFDVAVEDYLEEHPGLKPLSDVDDWRSLDNSMRAHDLR